MILLKMKEMRQCYSELRGRVGHIERKKRRAKRREKELQGMCVCTYVFIKVTAGRHGYLLRASQ